MLELSFKKSRHLRWGLAVASVIGLSIWPVVAPQAQHGSSETPVSVTGVTTHTKGQDAVVTVSSDGALAHAQTWQDDEGFHVVVYKGQGALRGLPRGVKARRVGDSLELVVPVKPGGSVYVEPHFNQLDLLVNGGLQTNTSESARQSAHASPAQAAERERNSEHAPSRGRQANEQSSSEVVAREGNRRKLSTAQSGTTVNTSAAAQPTHSKPQASAPTEAQHDAPKAAPSVPPQVAQNILPPSYQNNGAAQSQPPAVNVAQAAPPTSAQPAAQPPAPALPVEDKSGARTSASTFGLLGLVLVAGMTTVLFIYRRRRKADDDWAEADDEETSTALTKPAPQTLSRMEAKAQSNGTQGSSAMRLEPHPQGE
ncbi:MAG TPA: hypothetical protein VE821_13185, partial [Pyrinomonadaceae bacterium]|nr:hypothetical protein [Pyrinomonadaceae bacterium]